MLFIHQFEYKVCKSLTDMASEENVTVKDAPPQIDPLDRSGSFICFIK